MFSDTNLFPVIGSPVLVDFSKKKTYNDRTSLNIEQYRRLVEPLVTHIDLKCD